MKQASRLLSTYTADVSGVCSALYELGGLTIMHDASGCNSTYNTHDEPRWYDQPSMVYISALTEIDAVMGADDKLIGDIVAAAQDLHPRFIAVAGTPIPMMMGTDFIGVAAAIERQTGLPTLGLATNGMHSYSEGISMALIALAKRFCAADSPPLAVGVGQKPAVNLLGVTPLDFSVNGSVDALKLAFLQRGYPLVSCWAMGSSLEQLCQSGQAQVNAVVSAAGLNLARWLQQVYGTPYVIGQPLGSEFADVYFRCIDQAASQKCNICAYAALGQVKQSGPATLIIGEAVAACSLKAAMMGESGCGNIQAVTPLDAEDALLGQGDRRIGG
ncbi:MAG: nitrogenase component 1, partial [Clostridiales bacterium]